MFQQQQQYMLLVTSVCFVADLPTDMEMSKVVADLEYVLVDSSCLADDADVNADDSMPASSDALMKV